MPVTRINFLLLLALIMSALSLVNSQRQARQVFVQLEEEKALEQKLLQDKARLQYEVARIGIIARRRVSMQAPTPDRIHYLIDTQHDFTPEKK